MKTWTNLLSVYYEAQQGLVDFLTSLESGIWLAVVSALEIAADWFQGTALEPTDLQALPAESSSIRASLALQSEVEPREQSVPRQSPGTKNFTGRVSREVPFFQAERLPRLAVLNSNRLEKIMEKATYTQTLLQLAKSRNLPSEVQRMFRGIADENFAREILCEDDSTGFLKPDGPWVVNARLRAMVFHQVGFVRPSLNGTYEKTQLLLAVEKLYMLAAEAEKMPKSSDAAKCVLSAVRKLTIEAKKMCKEEGLNPRVYEQYYFPNPQVHLEVQLMNGFLVS